MFLVVPVSVIHPQQIPPPKEPGLVATPLRLFLPLRLLLLQLMLLLLMMLLWLMLATTMSKSSR
jgi:hypothetical protein